MASYAPEEIPTPPMQWPTDADAGEVDSSCCVSPIYSISVASNAQVHSSAPAIQLPAPAGQPFFSSNVSSPGMIPSSSVSASSSSQYSAAAAAADDDDDAPPQASAYEPSETSMASFSHSNSLSGTDTYTNNSSSLYLASSIEHLGAAAQQASRIPSPLQLPPPVAALRRTAAPPPPCTRSESREGLQVARATIYRDREGNIVKVEEMEAGVGMGVGKKAKGLVRKMWGRLKYYYVIRGEEGYA